MALRLRSALRLWARGGALSPEAAAGDLPASCRGMGYRRLAALGAAAGFAVGSVSVAGFAAVPGSGVRSAVHFEVRFESHSDSSLHLIRFISSKLVLEVVLERVFKLVGILQVVLMLVWRLFCRVFCNVF